MKAIQLLILSIFISLLVGSCKIERVFSPKSPYEKYKQSLVNANLSNTALARDWIAAGEDAKTNALTVNMPYQEIIKFNIHEPKAVVLKYVVAEGQNITISVNPLSSESNPLFINSFEIQDDEFKSIQIQEINDSINYVVKKSGEHALRIQPELLRGGIFQVYIGYTSSLAFPIHNKDYKSIGSFFGDVRDAGKRRHEGVDVFAPKGAPVTAVTSGIITRVGTNNLGGKIVFQSGGGYSYYYAHLDSQLVHTGKRVAPGDTIGLVGNTGNAIHTLPHLHFGIYSLGRGAVDPFPFFAFSQQAPLADLSDTVSLNQYYRVANAKVNLRTNASTQASVVRQLSKDDLVLIEATVKDWYRVKLPDSTRAFVFKNLLSTTDSPLKTLSLSENDLAKDNYNSNTYFLTNILDSEAELLGKFEDHSLIRFSSGEKLWLKEMRDE